ncbi:MAG: ABC transporter ATP-binding protein [Ignavibacteria bacterium]|nr:ABC transporter ATP-binding protein [Ignavibacteria bacterium]
MMNKIELVGICKTFGDIPVLKDITFSATEEDFCVLVGPSGCGKTTILRIIAGLEQPTNGEIFFNGNKWNEVPPGERNVGMVFQNYALYPHLSVFENISFPLWVRREDKKSIEERVQKVSIMLGLKDKLDKKPKELSGGEKQRVALARAIVRQPNVFLFDEPLSNLDAKLRVVMRTEIVNLVKDLRVPAIYVTHDQIEALTMGTKIVVLKDGEIQQVGSPNDIYYKPANTFVATFIGVPQMNLFEGVVRDGVFCEKNSLFKLPLPDNLPCDGELIIGIRPEDFFIVDEKDAKIKTVVRTYEYIGYETIIYFEHFGKLFSLLLRKEQPKPTLNDKICLDFPVTSIHFFSGNGKRIEFNS